MYGKALLILGMKRMLMLETSFQFILFFSNAYCKA